MVARRLDLNLARTSRDLAQAVRRTAMASERNITPLVFICYCHADADAKKELVRHLLGLTEPLGLKDSNYLLVWSDEQIRAGEDWQQRIQEELSKVRVAILLVSSGFLASEFIIGREVPRILERLQRKRRGVEPLDVIPILGKPCAYQLHDWLKRLQLRPRDGAFVWSSESESQRDMHLAGIAQEVFSILRPILPGTGSVRTTSSRNRHVDASASRLVLATEKDGDRRFGGRQ
jgi:hypothetical protein